MRDNRPMFSQRSWSEILNGGLLLLCLSLPWLSPLVVRPSPSVAPLLVSWMLAACAVLLVSDWPGPVPVWRRRTLVWGALLVGWLLLSLLLVPEVVDHALTLGLLASLACVAVMAMVGRRVHLGGQAKMSWLVAAWLFAAGLSSVLGLLQYLDLAHGLSTWVNQPLRGDAFANLRQRNQFATLTSLGLVVLLAWVAQQEASAQGVRAWRRGLSWGLLALLAAGVSTSVSRTGALEWGCVVTLAVLWARRAQRQGERGRQVFWMALAGLVLVAVWSCVLPWLSYQMTGHWGASLLLRVTGQAQEYAMCGRRSVLWHNVLTMLVQHPWLGWGWGETDYAHFMTLYAGPRFCDMVDNAHDLPLHLALEFGLPLALALCGSGLVWAWHRRPWAEHAPWRAMAWGLLLVLLVHSMLEYPLWYGPFQMTLGLALGLLGARNTDATSAPLSAPAPSPWLQAAPVLLGSALFVGCLYAVWDYQRVSQIYLPPQARLAIYSDHPLVYARQSWLFRNQAEFAELTMQTVTADNAAVMYPLARRVMHYSPEPRVVQRAIDSARLLGLNDQVQILTERLQAVQDNAPITQNIAASAASH